MAQNKQLRKRLTRYVEAVNKGLEQSDSEDSSFHQGFDQALLNVVWSLSRMLEDTK